MDVIHFNLIQLSDLSENGKSTTNKYYASEILCGQQPGIDSAAVPQGVLSRILILGLRFCGEISPAIVHAARFTIPIACFRRRYSVGIPCVGRFNVIGKHIAGIAVDDFIRSGDPAGTARGRAHSKRRSTSCTATTWNRSVCARAPMGRRDTIATMEDSVHVYECRCIRSPACLQLTHSRIPLPTPSPVCFHAFSRDATQQEQLLPSGTSATALDTLIFIINASLGCTHARGVRLRREEIYVSGIRKSLSVQ